MQNIASSSRAAHICNPSQIPSSRPAWAMEWEFCLHKQIRTKQSKIDGTWEKAQLIKFVPWKHEDQCLGPRSFHVKKSSVAMCTGEDKTTDPWDLLAGHSSLLSESVTGQWGALCQNNQNKNKKQNPAFWVHTATTDLRFKIPSILSNL